MRFHNDGFIISSVIIIIKKIINCMNKCITMRPCVFVKHKNIHSHNNNKCINKFIGSFDYYFVIVCRLFDYAEINQSCFTNKNWMWVCVNYERMLVERNCATRCGGKINFVHLHFLDNGLKSTQATEMCPKIFLKYRL